MAEQEGLKCTPLAQFIIAQTKYISDRYTAIGISNVSFNMCASRNREGRSHSRSENHPNGISILSSLRCADRTQDE